MIGQLESASVREDQNKAECGKQEMTVSKFSKKQSKVRRNKTDRREEDEQIH